MTTKHQPATPLPWSEPVNYGNVSFEIQSCSQQVLVGKKWTIQDVRYVSHAANAYPRLVQALQDLLPDPEASNYTKAEQRASALLRELGEE